MKCSGNNSGSCLTCAGPILVVILLLLLACFNLIIVHDIVVLINRSSRVSVLILSMKTCKQLNSLQANTR